ncbi:hypothetical protein C8R47DRAFT_400300 [Mycena vitilis]|nr:hypothetical protein C8R47DRAFT_400300 [Mycena vitilis]
MRFSLALFIASVAGLATAQSCHSNQGTCKYTSDCHSPAYYHVAGRSLHVSRQHGLIVLPRPQATARGRQTTSAAFRRAASYARLQNATWRIASCWAGNRAAKYDISVCCFLFDTSRTTR